MNLPAGQPMQSPSSSLRVVSTYLPAGQSVHSKLPAAEYFPTAHGAQPLSEYGPLEVQAETLRVPA